MTGCLLVTGGTGLVGSTVALLAARQGRRVRALVRGRDAAPLTGAGVETAVGDVTDPGSLDAAMSGVTEVVNAAAVLGGTWVKAAPREMWAVNHDGALNVLDAAARAGIGTMRQFVERRRARPLFDATATSGALDYQPASLTEGLAATVEWLRASGQLPAGACHATNPAPRPAPREAMP